MVLGTAWRPVLAPAGARGLPGAGGTKVSSGTASHCSSSGSPEGDLGLLLHFLRSLKVKQLLTSLCPSVGRLPSLSRAEGWSRAFFRAAR